MTNLDSILRSRDITLPRKVCLVKTMVFPVVMYGCESWSVKKAECWRINAFELWYWRRLLRVPWTARRSNQSILKEMGVHWKDCCWSRNSNTLATWCKELTHWKRPWCWERLKAGGEGDNREWDGWMASPTQWTWVWVNSRSWWWTGRPGVLWFIGSQRVGHDWATELKYLSGDHLGLVTLCISLNRADEKYSSVPGLTLSLKWCFTDMAWIRWLLFTSLRSLSCIRSPSLVSCCTPATEDSDHKLYINSTCRATSEVNLCC